MKRLIVFIATALLFALALYLMACLWFAMIGHRIRSYEAGPEPIVQSLPEGGGI